MRIMKVYYSNMPIPSMYGTFTYISYGNQPDIGKYILYTDGIGYTNHKALLEFNTYKSMSVKSPSNMGLIWLDYIIPDAQCMVYLPTFTINLGQM